jgi:hypothetical protein
MFLIAILYELVKFSGEKWDLDNMFQDNMITLSSYNEKMVKLLW